MNNNNKYFGGYLDEDYKIKLLHIMLPKTSMCIKKCNGETKCILKLGIFLIEDDELLEKY